MDTPPSVNRIFFCASILMMTIVTNLVCFVTIKLNTVSPSVPDA